MTSDAYHKRYVALEGQYGPPPHAHYAPHRHKAHRGSSGCGCGCGLALSLDVKAFDIRGDNKIYSDIVVVVKAENPNEGIGLEYLDNKVNIMYSGSTLCSGNFPPFLQPHKNTTKVNMELKGVE
ncbi:Late embryogenesis abundant protein [Sesbania bispinosa]|nr:Late embryogenesis abundant protein [Sesbania bispinosa]